MFHARSIARQSIQTTSSSNRFPWKSIRNIETFLGSCYERNFDEHSTFISWHISYSRKERKSNFLSYIYTPKIDPFVHENTRTRVSKRYQKSAERHLLSRRERHTRVSLTRLPAPAFLPSFLPSFPLRQPPYFPLSLLLPSLCKYVSRTVYDRSTPVNPFTLLPSPSEWRSLTIFPGITNDTRDNGRCYRPVDAPWPMPIRLRSQKYATTRFSLFAVNPGKRGGEGGSPFRGRCNRRSGRAHFSSSFSRGSRGRTRRPTTVIDHRSRAPFLTRISRPLPHRGRQKLGEGGLGSRSLLCRDFTLFRRLVGDWSVMVVYRIWLGVEAWDVLLLLLVAMVVLLVVLRLERRRVWKFWTITVSPLSGLALSIEFYSWRKLFYIFHESEYGRIDRGADRLSLRLSWNSFRESNFFLQIGRCSKRIFVWNCNGSSLNFVTMGEREGGRVSHWFIFRLQNGEFFGFLFPCPVNEWLATRR